MKRASVQRGPGPLDLVEEAVHLLRRAPAATLAAYYLGSLPFVLGLLFFWADMSRGSFAGNRLAQGALGLTLLFVWMKAWQAVFARRLLARLCGEAETRVSWRGLGRIALAQAFLQPSGLLALPLTLVSLVPVGWVYAFYQNVTALDEGDGTSPRELAQRAWRQARLWPAQNQSGLLVLHRFGFFVFLNLATAFVLVPSLLKSLLGIETTFSRTWMALLNTTTLATLVSLTYLCLDPLAKAFYVLRCFYGESLGTGRDLRAELRGLATPRLAGVAVVLLTLGLGANALGQPGTQNLKSETRNRKPEVQNAELGTRNTRLETRNLPLAPPDLDRAIREVIAQPEFNWRLPRENRADEKGEKGAFASLVANVIRAVRDGVQAVFDWIEKLLERLFGGRARGGGFLSWLSGLPWALVALIILLACLLAVMLLRLWRRRRRPATVAAQPVPAAPDLADENIGADQLPADGWARLARDLIGQGELRLALRAFYLASLADLANRDLIGLARFKSNRDYQCEVDRRSHALPDLARIFAENVVVFDRAWYGLHEVSREMVEHFAGNVDRIKGLT